MKYQFKTFALKTRYLDRTLAIPLSFYYFYQKTTTTPINCYLKGVFTKPEKFDI